MSRTLGLRALADLDGASGPYLGLCGRAGAHGAPPAQVRKAADRSGGADGTAMSLHAIQPSDALDAGPELNQLWTKYTDIEPMWFDGLKT